MKISTLAAVGAAAFAAASLAVLPAAEASTWNPGDIYSGNRSNAPLLVKGDGGHLETIQPYSSPHFFDDDWYYVAPNQKATAWFIPVGTGWHHVRDGFQVRVDVRWR